jgi:hypothetical protein
MSHAASITPSHEQISGFQSLYREHFGVTLEEEEARETLTRLLTLYITVLDVTHHNGHKNQKSC